jgi:5'-3' exonuclease
MSKHILLIDLSGIFWANWHATSDQSVSEAFERTVSKVASLRSGYDHVAVCCDVAPYWRKDVLPTYKAQRDAPPPQAVEQFARVRERLEADGLLLWGAKGFEADDVIAFAVENARRDGHRVTIASGDKDLLQLVCDDVRCVSTASGVTYTTEQVQLKFGVGPGKMIDFLSLVGDASDNVPGVPGVGPKTASALLNEFGTLDAVLDEAEKPPAASDADEDGSRITKPKLKASLMEHAPAALLARRVITLRTDVPLDWKEIYMDREPKPLAEPTSITEDEPEASAPEAAPPPASRPKTLGIEKQAPPEVRALAIRAPEEWSLALEPRSAKAAWEIAGALFNSRLYQNFGSQDAIYAVILRGRALGLDMTTALAVFHNLRGKLTMHADLIEALVLRSGKAQYFEMVESTAMQATYATKRMGGRNEQRITFTIEDAFYAGLVVKDPNGRDGYSGISESGKPSNYDKYRATMLRHRAKTQLARAVYSDVVLGLYSIDEMDEHHTGVIDASFEAA